MSFQKKLKLVLEQIDDDVIENSIQQHLQTCQSLRLEYEKSLNNLMNNLKGSFDQRQPTEVGSFNQQPTTEVAMIVSPSSDTIPNDEPNQDDTMAMPDRMSQIIMSALDDQEDAFTR